MWVPGYSRYETRKVKIDVSSDLRPSLVRGGVKKKNISKMSIVQQTAVDMRLKQLGHEMDAFAARCDKVFFSCESERFM